LGNFFAVSQAIFDVQPDGVLNVRDRLFVGLPLAVTALERRTGDETAVLVALNDDGKRQVLHAPSQLLAQSKRKQSLLARAPPLARRAAWLEIQQSTAPLVM
jgi:hypothetical protein